MKSIIIVDNIGVGKAKGEWGLCIFIEYNGKNILLDTGNSPLFAKNLEVSGIDINDINFAVLSHAHSDHANGMEKFFERNTAAKFYLQQYCEESCYCKFGFLKRYVGIPPGILEKYKERIVYAQGKLEVCDGVTLLPHKKADKTVGKIQHMYIKKNRKMIPDDFAHEQSLVFRTEKGLVIFNSCSHAGADIIINEVSEAFQQEKIFAIVGGLHLVARSEGYIRGLARRIIDTGIEKVYTGHCTKEKGYKILKQELGDRVEQFKVGMIMEF